VWAHPGNFVTCGPHTPSGGLLVNVNVERTFRHRLEQSPRAGSHYPPVRIVSPRLERHFSIEIPPAKTIQFDGRQKGFFSQARTLLNRCLLGQMFELPPRAAPCFACEGQCKLSPHARGNERKK